MKVWPTHRASSVCFFSREYWTAAMAGSSGDSITRRSVASQFFTQEEGPGIDGMTTSERVSMERRAWSREGHSPLQVAEPRECQGGWAGKAGTITCLSLAFQVVDLLNQAALITNDSKITVLKQVREGAREPVKKKTLVVTLVSPFKHLG